MASSTPTSESTHITASFLLSNLHCPSNVSHIKDVLSSLKPARMAVAPSLLSSSITIIHEALLREWSWDAPEAQMCIYIASSYLRFEGIEFKIIEYTTLFSTGYEPSAALLLRFDRKKKEKNRLWNASTNPNMACNCRYV